MSLPELRPVCLLDPRRVDAQRGDPIRDSVRIPWPELADRVHELPPRTREIRVASVGNDAERAVAWLRSEQRRAALAPDFEYAAHGEPPARCRLWEPSPFLAECAAELEPGRALELACGVGRDAVYLASRGWDVLAVDVLPDAVERACALRDRYLPEGRLRFERRELEAASPDDFKDWVSGFDLISVARYLHRPLFERFARWLRPGGSLVYETFTTEHRARHGRPRRDAFVLQAGELASAVPGLPVRHASEAWHDDAHTARLWACKPA